MNLLHLAFLFLLAAGVVLSLMYAGTGKHALERKRASRVCPACGRLTTECRCTR